MKIATYNANSIRSRIGIIQDWICLNKPNILCLQETKVQDVDFPVDEFSDIGYHLLYKGQKAYNGVAIFSQEPAQEIITSLKEDCYDEARFLAATYKTCTIVNTYIPQGQDINSDKFRYKLSYFDWLKSFFSKTCSPTMPIIWAGDLNVAMADIDVYDPQKLYGDVCFCKQVQEAMQSVMDWGFVDLFRQFHPNQTGHYTFWDYRASNTFGRNLGWRLDYILATAPLAERCTTCYIDRRPRGLEKPSDHTFVVAEFKDM